MPRHPCRAGKGGGVVRGASGRAYTFCGRAKNDLRIYDFVARFVCYSRAGEKDLAPRGPAASARRARADESPSDYQIYPSVHEMTYGDSWILRPSANVLVEDGIDADARARLDEALALKDIDATPVTEVPAGGYQMNVLEGVKGSGGAVDTYVDQLVSSGALTPADGLFEKSDAYLLASLKGDAHAADTIVVLGRDTDSAFYGLTTLYQFFQQLEGTLRLRGFVCSDWADVVSRGFIEDYYGNPWSTEDRVNLMTWGGYYKLNAYVYAPKDDPLHRINWRGLYTDEEIARELRPQAEAGNRSKVRFVYALAPFHNSDGARRPFRFDSEAHYQEDLADLKAKYLQTIDVGVRQIALLADDSTDWGRLYGNEATYLRILNDLTSWIHELQALRGADGTPRYATLGVLALRKGFQRR